jgi:transposase-like protein
MLRLVIEEVALSPVDVPKRTTHVEVQWRSSAVTKLEVPRPDRTHRHTPPEAVERIRGMVKEGMSDQEIAERLNEVGSMTGASRPWNALAVSWARTRNKITQLREDCPCDQPVPDRHPDGRYSIAATAKRFGVSLAVVRRWARQGLVHSERERYGAHPFVWWLRIDRATAARLARVAKRSPHRRGRAPARFAGPPRQRPHQRHHFA